MSIPSESDYDVEELPKEESRHRQLVDPAAELEVVRRQQALFTEQARLRQLKREDGMAWRWGIVTHVAVPAGVLIFGGAALAFLLLLMNRIASDFWTQTHWF